MDVDSQHGLNFNELLAQWMILDHVDRFVYAKRSDLVLKWGINM